MAWEWLLPADALAVDTATAGRTTVARIATVGIQR